MLTMPKQGWLKRQTNNFQRSMNVMLAGALMLGSTVGLLPQTALAANNGDVQIAAAMPHPPSAGTEYVTVKNVSDSAIDLDGWEINDGSNHEITASSALAADTEVKICESDVLTDCAAGYTITALGLNDSDTISLKDSDSTVIDTVSYTTADYTNGTEVTFTTAADTTGPAITNTTPRDGGVISGNNYTVSAEISDPNGVDVNGVTYDLKYVGKASNGNTRTFTKLGGARMDLVSGDTYTATLDTTSLPTARSYLNNTYDVVSWTFEFNATDNNSNSSELIVDNVTIDTTGPAITNTAPDDRDVISGTDYTVSANVSDASGVTRVSYSVNARGAATDGNGIPQETGVAGDFMTLESGDFYTATLDTTSLPTTFEHEVDGSTQTIDVVEYKFTFTAVDSSGNVNATIDHVFDVKVDNSADTGPVYRTDDSGGAEEYFSTIQAAVSDNSATDSEGTENGETIVVTNGTYNEDVTVDKELTIKGANAGTAGQAARTAESVITGNMEVTASNVTIDGFTFKDYVGTGVRVDADNKGAFSSITLKNNIVEKTDGGFVDGFEFVGEFNNVTIANNLFKNGNTGKSNNADISFVGDTDGSDQLSTGLEVYGNKSVNGATFINLSNTTGTVIRDNYVAGAAGSALFMAGDNHNTDIKENTVIDGAGTAVNITNHFGYGSNENTDVFHNNISSNAKGAATGGLGPVSGALDLSENWWGDVSGPSGEGSGTGNSIEAGIDYKPWLCQPFQDSLRASEGGSCATDTTKPTIIIDDPVAGVIVGNTLDISGTVTDENFSYYFYNVSGPQNIGSVTVYQEKTDKPLGRIDTSNLPEGNYSLNIIAHDTKGNKAVKSVAFTVDHTAPTVELIDPTPAGEALVSGTITVRATFQDEHGLSRIFCGVHGHFWVLDNPNSPDNGTYECKIDTTKLPRDGDYVIRVAAVDKAGNGTAFTNGQNISLDRNITVDNTKPVLEVDQPQAGASASGTVDLSGTITDKHFSYYYYHVTGSQNVPSVTVYSQKTDEKLGALNTTQVPDGDYTLHFTVHDAAGNVSRASIPLTVDNSGPAAPTITSPTARQYFKTAPIRATWTAVSDPSGIANYEVEYIYDDDHTFTGGPTRLVDGDQTYRDHRPGEGEQGGVTIRVRAIDGLGNKGAWSQPVHYYYDHEAPATDITVSPVVGGTFTVSGDASDNLALNLVYVQLVNREDNNRYGGTNINLIPEGDSAHWSKTYDISALGYPDGDYAAHVSVVDMAGNSSAAGWTENFTVDNDNSNTDDNGELVGTPKPAVPNKDGEFTPGTLYFMWVACYSYLPSFPDCDRENAVKPLAGEINYGAWKDDTYDLRVFSVDPAEETDLSAALTIENTDQTSYNPKAGEQTLAGPGDYWWQVRACDELSSNCSEWSTPTRFTLLEVGGRGGNTGQFSPASRQTRLAAGAPLGAFAASGGLNSLAGDAASSQADNENGQQNQTGKKDGGSEVTALNTSSGGDSDKKAVAGEAKAKNRPASRSLP